MSPINYQCNRVIRDALVAALTAVAHLEARGCAVGCVVAKGGRPTLLIDRPSVDLGAVVESTRIDNGVRRDVASVDLYGCLVEWETQPGRNAA